jgi:apolipoprotein D and lipocalin family protein
MLSKAVILSFAWAIAASPVAVPQTDASSSTPAIAVDTIFDGKCYYPKADSRFQLDTFLGRWYQLAATNAPFSLGCTCVTADYSLNENGEVNVFNTCQRLGRSSTINGTAAPSDAKYGEKGVLRVSFPDVPNVNPCPGPNYIVQVYEGDWAIVQAPFFLDLFILSRKQNVPEAELDAWLQRAESLGSNLALVSKTDQTNCQSN